MYESCACLGCAGNRCQQPSLLRLEVLSTGLNGTVVWNVRSRKKRVRVLSMTRQQLQGQTIPDPAQIRTRFCSAATFLPLKFQPPPHPLHLLCTRLDMQAPQASSSAKDDARVRITEKWEAPYAYGFITRFTMLKKRVPQLNTPME